MPVIDLFLHNWNKEKVAVCRKSNKLLELMEEIGVNAPLDEFVLLFVLLRSL